jgi:hypothetical protein
MQLKYTSLLLLFIVFYPFNVDAQLVLQRSAISAFGGSKVSNEIYISHTAGQSSGYTQTGNGSLDLRQGFEQALLFSNGNDQQSVRMVVYPNPNSGTFYIATDLPRGTNYTLFIQDIELETAASKYITVKKNIARLTSELKALEEQIKKAATHNKCMIGSLSVTRFKTQAPIDYKKVPELQGLEKSYLDSFRGKERETTRITIKGEKND